MKLRELIDKLTNGGDPNEYYIRVNGEVSFADYELQENDRIHVAPLDVHEWGAKWSFAWNADDNPAMPCWVAEVFETVVKRRRYYLYAADEDTAIERALSGQNWLEEDIQTEEVSDRQLFDIKQGEMP